MVTLPWHSGRPPVCAGMAEGVEKGGVSPLVLFAGVTGHRQEAAQRVLRLRLCRVRCQVIPNRLQVQVPVAGSGNEKKKKRKKPPASTVYYLQISTCARVPLQTPPSLLPCKTPPEDCVPMRGRTKDSLPVTFVCTVFTGMVLLPLENTVTDITVKNHKAKTNKRSWICLSEIGAYCAITYRILTYVLKEFLIHPPTWMEKQI